MTSGPITSWQVDGGRVEIMSNFIFLGPQITADCDCSHNIKRRFASWKKSYDKPRQHIKNQRHHFTNKVHLVKAMIFPVVTYRYESWMIKKAECQRIDAF